MEHFKFVIIGTGFAGASTAYHLARREAGKVLLLEQEPGPGAHASGRNAAMIRQVVPDPEIAKVARFSARRLGLGLSGHEVEAQADEVLRPSVSIRKNGSLLLAHGEGWERLQRDARLAQQAGHPVACWTPQQILDKVSVLEGARFDGGVWNPDDGIVELAPLLNGFIEGARKKGAEVSFQEPLHDVEHSGDGFELGTSRRTVRAEVLINASGAWAGTIGEMAGSRDIELTPLRRHLYHSTPLPWVDEAWPFVWDVSADLYFRPETGGLLLSACDESPHPPGLPMTDDAVEELLARKMADHLPAFPDLAIQKRWACLRTLSSDGRFVIGWDPAVSNFFWVAGLGGHGVTCSYGVGDMAAGLLLREAVAGAEPFSPSRFQ